MKATTTHSETTFSPKAPTLGLATNHIRKTLKEISDGITKRLKTVREAIVTEPAEDYAWELSAKLNRVKTKMFKKIDTKIEEILAKSKKAGSEALEMERFDGEGGAMMPTSSSSSRRLACLPKPVLGPLE